MIQKLLFYHTISRINQEKGEYESKGVEYMQRIYIGTFTSGQSKGIYYGSFFDGKIKLEGSYYVPNPSYLHKEGNHLYAVSEGLDGSALSFEICDDGTLVKTGEKKIFGDGPCHISVYNSFLFTANYGSGSVSEFMLDHKGRIAYPPKLIVHYGSSTHKTRQQEPHVHQCLITPDKKRLAVCDLGIDTVCFYPIDEKGIHEIPDRFALPSGSGPRHLCFGLGQRWYLMGELTSEIFVCEGYGNQGQIVQKVQAAQASSLENAGAAIALSPLGDCLLCSIRGEGTLVLFDIDDQGLLYNKRVYPAGGTWPRDAAFSPDGSYVLAALEKAGQVVVFKRDKEKLHQVDCLSIPGAACICF